MNCLQLLFYDEREPIWRWSFNAAYIVLNAKNNQTYPVSFYLWNAGLITEFSTFLIPPISPNPPPPETFP